MIRSRLPAAAHDVSRITCSPARAVAQFRRFRPASPDDVSAFRQRRHRRAPRRVGTLRADSDGGERLTARASPRWALRADSGRGGGGQTALASSAAARHGSADGARLAASGPQGRQRRRQRRGGGSGSGAAVVVRWRQWRRGGGGGGGASVTKTPRTVPARSPTPADGIDRLSSGIARPSSPAQSLEPPQYKSDHPRVPRPPQSRQIDG